MTEFTKDYLQTEEGQQEFTRWVQQQYQAIGRYAHGQGLIPEDADGQAVWSVPGRILMAKVWPKADREATYWVITGKDLPTDHVEAHVAATPRDAARHFALKWQLQAARISSLSSEEGGEEPVPAAEGVSWTDVGGKMSAQAEALYAYVQADEFWQGIPQP